jgi:hypothetical protein
MSIKSATVLLDHFRAEGIAVEVTHRSARRLFGLAGLAPLREAVAPRRRPQPGRGPGRPPHREIDEPTPMPTVPPPLPPVRVVERPPIDYGALEAAMIAAEDTVGRARHNLNALRAAPKATETWAGRDHEDTMD